MARTVLSWLPCLCVTLTLAAAGNIPEPSQTPRELAALLSENGVPAGFVLPTGEFELATPPRATELRASVSRQNLHIVLSRFNGEHPALQAAEDAGVIHVRSKSEPLSIRDSLERKIYVEPSDQITAFDAVFLRVVGILAGREPQGVAGTFVSSDQESNCAVAKPVQIGGESSVIELLDGIVQQSPGLVWFITYGPTPSDGDTKVGLLCPDGSYLRASVNF